MRITESKVRQIIREEAVRALREQAAPAGAAISNLTGADPAAAEATAKAAAKLLEPNPIFKSIFPGGYAELLPAIKSALLSLGSLFVPRPFMFVMQDMLQSGAIASIVSRERKAGKIPLEIMLSVAQAVAARSKSVNESRRRRRLREVSEGDFGGSAAEEDGAARWVVGNSGYELIDAPRDVADAWSRFCDAVEGLEEFMNDTYPDTESDGEPLTIGDAAVHQAATFLTER